METTPKFRKQKALYWAPSGVDRYGKKKRNSSYVELVVRWVDGDTLSINQQGEQITINATVILDRSVEVGGFFWKGSQEELEDTLPGTGTGSALFPEEDLFVVHSFSKTLDIKGRNARYEAKLIRWGDTLPGVGA
jgi:hypothetical protein